MKLLHDNLLLHKDELSAGIRAGKLFIYPTDTIYGIGCDATNEEAVNKVRALKHRETKPFLIIAPNLEWIWQNCDISEVSKKEIENKLPGRYAFFVKLKNTGAVAYDALVPSSRPERGTIGVRLPDHPFQEIISAAGRPFVTTSVNFASEPFATTLDQMPESIKEGVDYIIDVGELAGPQSVRINLTN